MENCLLGGAPRLSPDVKHIIIIIIITSPLLRLDQPALALTTPTNRSGSVTIGIRPSPSLVPSAFSGPASLAAKTFAAWLIQVAVLRRQACSHSDCPL